MGKQWASVCGHRDDNVGVTAGRVDYGRGVGTRTTVRVMGIGTTICRGEYRRRDNGGGAGIGTMMRG